MLEQGITSLLDYDSCLERYLLVCGVDRHRFELGQVDDNSI